MHTTSRQSLGGLSLICYHRERMHPTAFGIGTHPNGVEAAYMRFDLFERRWEFMEVWSDYLVNRLDG